MPATNSSALALAVRLRRDSDDALVALLRDRDVRDAGIRDYFDLAEKLLDPVSVQAALARLDRPTLAVIADLATHGRSGPSEIAERVGFDPARVLATAYDVAVVDLVDDAWSTFEAVATVLRGWPTQGFPSLDELSDAAPTALEPVSTADQSVTDLAAADTAFTSTSGIAELVAALERTPARELARGGIALPDARRLAEAASVDISEVPALQMIAENAGLVQQADASWFASDASHEWMLLPTAERWSRLAGAWLDRLPDDIRALLAGRAHALWGEHLERYLDWFYPAGGEVVRERVSTHTRAAALLGIVVSQAPSTPGSALLAEGVDAAATAMATLFPAEVDRVYLQHDLTVVSPGPLQPAIDARLRTLADVESRALASTYRISSASLNRGLSTGETAASITAFLDGISLTGVPQPLAYVIAESAARYGLVRVGMLENGRSYVRSSDASLLRTIQVDQGLSSLGLVPTGDRLVSRFAPGIVFWGLTDARYPVLAEDANGRPMALERVRPVMQARVASVDHATNIVARLRLLADEDGSGTDWLEHQLDAAVRAKVAVTVTITMPDGSDVEYTILPTSLASGRLRGLDRAADIERTLPVSRITAVRAPD